MNEYDKQRDIEAEGQRAAIFHNPAPPPEVSETTRRQGEAVIGLEQMAEAHGLTDLQALGVFLVAASRTVDRMVRQTGTRGKLINAAKDDFGRMLQKHVGFPGLDNLKK